MIKMAMQSLPPWKMTDAQTVQTVWRLNIDILQNWHSKYVCAFVDQSLIKNINYSAFMVKKGCNNSWLFFFEGSEDR